MSVHLTSAYAENFNEMGVNVIDFLLSCVYFLGGVST